jgi:hypothetical protein
MIRGTVTFCAGAANPSPEKKVASKHEIKAFIGFLPS